jgi:hypothetical protein
MPALHDLCLDPWAVIGSAAARVIGADVSVADVDVLTSVRDAEALQVHWAARLQSIDMTRGAETFRSHFARFSFPGLSVEIMGGLEVFAQGAWTPVDIGQIVIVDLHGVAVPVPTLAEQIRILQSFGRPKDWRRAARLKTLQRNGREQAVSQLLSFNQAKDHVHSVRT